MATWQQYDGLEARVSRVGGEIADLSNHLAQHWPDLASEHGPAIMAAAQALTDAMRAARYAVRDAVVAERGHRR